MEDTQTALFKSFCFSVCQWRTQFLVLVLKLPLTCNIFMLTSMTMEAQWTVDLQHSDSECVYRYPPTVTIGLL